MRIINEDGHRCGSYDVTFDGVPAVDPHVDVHPSDDVIAVVPIGARSGPVVISQDSGACVLLGFLSKENVHVGDFRVIGGDPVRPNITSFDASATTIDAGDSVNLTWSVSGDFDTLTLDARSVFGSSSTTVNPRTTSDYTLRAANGCNHNSETVRICVNVDQPVPAIRSVNSSYPGSAFSVLGNNLRFEGCAELLESSLLITQGRTSATITDTTPRLSSLNGTLPGSFSPGRATVIAKVGAETSDPISFEIPGRQNGSFRAVSLIHSGMDSCEIDGVTRTLSITGDSINKTATFTSGGSTLWRQGFTSAITQTGAALTPNCAGGVVVGQNTARSDDSYVLSVHNFETGNDFNANMLGQEVKVLFSRDDTVMLYKAQDNFRGVGFATINLYDFKRGGDISGPGAGISCSSCNSISAEIVDYRDVANIIFSGSPIAGSFRVE